MEDDAHLSLEKQLSKAHHTADNVREGDSRERRGQTQKDFLMSVNCF